MNDNNRNALQSAISCANLYVHDSCALYLINKLMKEGARRLMANSKNLSFFNGDARHQHQLEFASIVFFAARIHPKMNV